MCSSTLFGEKSITSSTDLWLQSVSPLWRRHPFMPCMHGRNWFGARGSPHTTHVCFQLSYVWMTKRTPVAWTWTFHIECIVLCSVEEWVSECVPGLLGYCVLLGPWHWLNDQRRGLFIFVLRRSLHWWCMAEMYLCAQIEWRSIWTIYKRCERCDARCIRNKRLRDLTVQCSSSTIDLDSVALIMLWLIHNLWARRGAQSTFTLSVPYIYIYIVVFASLKAPPNFHFEFGRAYRSLEQNKSG